MMSGCTNAELGLLLHDYELDLAQPDEKQRFEMHLYECDYCLGQVRDFQEVTRIMMAGPDTEAIIEEIGTDTEESSDQASSPFKLTNVTKYLLAAVLALTIAIPSYFLFSPGEMPAPSQKIVLLPVRTLEQPTVDLSKGGVVEIAFASEEFTAVETVDIRLLSRDLDTLFVQLDFKDFTPTGMGSVIVETDILSPGRHQLEVSERGATSPLRVYYFMVK
ncbi:MAG: hypothetical protein JSU65_02790 [Candidatus Zixiibacteriota bacterium]|nr:MAG: hypothetical protein JSU65_02790 [candidate division Zixibacteria bacterium]